MPQSFFREHRVQCYHPQGLHHMIYSDWGDQNNPNILICVHGLTRSRHDFDTLAQQLGQRFRIIAPDIVGRGESDWLSNPILYQVPQYVSDMITLIAQLNLKITDNIYWLGTSMGGLIGMTLASLKNTPLKKLIINDIGPAIETDSLKRIATYVGQPIEFDDFKSANQYIRMISDSFGTHSDSEWEQLSKNVLRQTQQGKWKLHYDPAISAPFKALVVSEQATTLEDWSIYDPIAIPVLAIRGENSDLLSEKTHLEMAQRGPCAQLLTLPNIGHAPTFMHQDQIDIINNFL